MDALLTVAVVVLVILAAVIVVQRVKYKNLVLQTEQSKKDLIEKEAILQKEAMIKAKEALHIEREQLNEDERERRREFAAIENKLSKREDILEDKIQEVSDKELELDKLKDQLIEKEDFLAEIVQKQTVELERIAGMSTEEAKRMLLEQLKSDLAQEQMQLIRENEAKIREDALEKSKEILTTTMQRCMMGMSAIISSADFNFWDDVALKSYAEVIGKRHAQLGINFEDELISKFNADHAISGARISEIATSLAGAIDAKDPYTKGHSTSVSRFSEALARAINLPEDEVERIKLGALLHDVGKIGIPETVLKKEGPLSDDEWAIMKQHPTIGAEKVLMPNPSLRDLIPIVKYHHERIDGKGYPEGLVNGDIPLAAKIVAIADTYHALISDRPYRRGMNIEKAISILNEGAGTQWDEDLVRTFIQIAPSLGV